MRWSLNFFYIVIFIFYLIPSLSEAAILFQDDFTGTTIDGAKWVTSGGTVGVDYIQNNNMNVRNSGGTSLPGAVTSLISATSFSRDDDLTISANITNTAGAAYMGYGDYAEGNYYIVRYGVGGNGQYWGFIVKNGTSYANNINCGAVTGGAKVSIKVTANSFNIYKNDVLTCSMSAGATPPAFTNKTIFLKGTTTGSFFDNILVENSAAAPVNTIPDAISDLSASLWGNTQTTLSWAIPSNGGDPIIDYTVDYRVNGDLPWNNFIDGVSVLNSATVTGLINGVTYDFRVRAVNGVGTADDSNIPTITVNAPIAPSTPSAPTASLIFDLDGRKASVAFSTPSANGSPITSYTVTSSPGGFTETVSSSPAVFSNLVNGTSYTFTVNATNAIGTSSNSSSSNSVSPSAFPDGNISWSQISGAGQKNWKDVAISSDGTKLAAVVSNGYIYTSSDSGVTWTEQTGSGVMGWTSIASSSDGTKLVATVFNGYIYTSSDSGVTWISRTGPGQKAWNDVTSSSNGSYLVAVHNTSTPYYSIDGGINWSTSLSSSQIWKAVASSDDGSKVYIAASADTVNFSSSNGVTFNSNGASGYREWSSLATSSDGSTIFATDNGGYLYKSTNSANSWTSQTILGTEIWNSVDTSSDASRIIVGGSYVYTSLDGGASWTQETKTSSWKSVSMTPDGTKVVALNYGGYIYTGVIDVTPPTITSISSDKLNGSYTTSEVIDIDVTFSEAVTSSGSVTVTLETGDTDRTCTFTITNSDTGTCNYVVQSGDNSLDLDISSISGTIDDQYSNRMTDFSIPSNLASNKAIVIDAISPIISEITSIPTPTLDTTPDYTFTTDKAGTISYGGSCSSTTTNASLGLNTITLDGLALGVYSDCTITVTDALLNISNILTFNTFTVSAPVVVENTVPHGAVAVYLLQAMSDRLRSNISLGDCKEGDIFSTITGRKCNPGLNQPVNVSCPVLLDNPKVLKLNMTHLNIQILQKILNCKGYNVSFSGAGSNGKETTKFASKTKQAVILFQKANNLIPDGIVGPKTIKILNLP